MKRTFGDRATVLFMRISIHCSACYKEFIRIVIRTDGGMFSMGVQVKRDAYSNMVTLYTCLPLFFSTVQIFEMSGLKFVFRYPELEQHYELQETLGSGKLLVVFCALVCRAMLHAWA